MENTGNYIVYETTNLISGKFYIGVHKVKGAGNGRYLGSGLALKGAIKKYGRDNFKREMLFRFDSSEEAYLKEAEIVNEEMISNINCYNMRQGGCGGSICGENNPNYGKTHSEETKKKIGKAHKGKVISEEAKKRMSQSIKGKTHSEETKKKISASKKGKKLSEEALKKMSKVCIIKEEKFESVKKASEHLRVHSSTVSYWCRNPNNLDCYYINSNTGA